MIYFCNRNVKWRIGSENTGLNVVLDSRYCDGGSSTGKLLINSPTEPVMGSGVKMLS